MRDVKMALFVILFPSSFGKGFLGINKLPD
jgi:hypothetical protein